MIKNTIICLLLISGHSSRAQPDDKILSADKIITLIPSKIKEFSPSSESKSMVIKLGTLQYSMAEKNFSASRSRSIKILLFDYNEASIMYKQATQKFRTFAPVESDSSIQRFISMPGYEGWETYNVVQKRSQILLGIHQRFFLTIESMNVDLESLQQVVWEFKLGDFPH